MPHTRKMFSLLEKNQELILKRKSLFGKRMPRNMMPNIEKLREISSKPRELPRTTERSTLMLSQRSLY